MLVQLVFPGALDKFSGKYSLNNGQIWTEAIKTVLANDYNHLFDKDEKLKPFVIACLNRVIVSDIKGLKCVDGDILMLLCATSGG
ncbi:MAG: hypothetical protein WAW86_10415 [Gammaproteobacteria bacterium]